MGIQASDGELSPARRSSRQLRQLTARTLLDPAGLEQGLDLGHVVVHRRAGLAAGLARSR